MNPETLTQVWVLYDESGEYTSYRLSIFGVFSSPELAMAAGDEYWRKAESRHPSNILKWDEWRYTDTYGKSDGAWHKSQSAPRRASVVTMTVAPYILNTVEQEP